VSNYIGVCHIHSTVSSDAELTIAEIARFFKSRQYHFVCLTEHSPKPDGEYLNREDIQIIVDECRVLSDESFVMVPGLECETDNNAHILGIGVTQPIESKNCLEVIDLIKRQEGIAVLAHPFFFNNRYPQEMIEKLDGLEVWNGSKNPFPDAVACFKIKALHRKGITPLAYFGLDFHRQEHYRQLSIIISENELTAPAVIKGLKSGSYLLHSQIYEISPFADFPIHKLIQWYIQARLFFTTRKWAIGIKKKLNEKGVKIPEKAVTAIKRFYFGN